MLSLVFPLGLRALVRMNGHTRGMKTLFLTGGSRGVGGALADRLANSWNLIMLARNEERASELEGRYPGCRTVITDLSDPKAAAASVARSLENSGATIDAFVSCAGVEGATALESLEAGALERIYAINVLSPVMLTNALLPYLRESRGTVVYVGSTAAQLTFPGWLPYSTSKAALEKAASVLRAEERTLRVSTVTPGRIDTDMQRDMAAKQSREFDPATAMSPASVAWAIQMALEAPSDVVVEQITVTPNR